MSRIFLFALAINIAFIFDCMSYAQNGGSQPKKFPEISSFNAPTPKEIRDIYKFIENWELFPSMVETYAMHATGERFNKVGGDSPSTSLDHFSFTLAERKNEKMLRIIYASEDPVKSEIAQTVYEELGPEIFIYQPKFLDILDIDGNLTRKQGMTADVTTVKTKTGRDDRIRAMSKYGIFAPELIVGRTKLGDANTTNQKPLSQMLPPKLLVGIIKDGNQIMARWERRLDDVIGLGIYVVFQDEVPILYEEIQEHKVAGELKRVRSQGFTNISWDTLNTEQGELFLPRTIKSKSRFNGPDFEYEYVANLAWKIGKEVDDKWFQVSSIGKIPVNSD